MPAALCSSATGTMRPCSGRIWSTASPWFLMFSVVAVALRIGGLIGAAFGAGGAYAHAFHRGLLAGLGEVIRTDGRRRRDDLLEILPVGVVGDQGGTLTRERAHA